MEEPVKTGGGHTQGESSETEGDEQTKKTVPESRKEQTVLRATVYEQKRS